MDRRLFLTLIAKTLATASSVWASRSGFAQSPENFLDFSDPQSPENFDADVCIIGAGPAGISIALELASTGKRVLLVHGGGDNASLESQSFYQGTNSPDSTAYPMDRSRLNGLGGATGHWTGWCSTLSPMDFEQRDWVEHSGWPISYEDMVPYYEKAQAYFKLGNPAHYEGSFWADEFPDLPRFNAENVLTNIWQFSSPPINFGSAYRDALQSVPQLTVLQNAQVTELRTTENKTAIDRAVIGSSSGNSGLIRAKQFVVACGGIENPRLLLSSRQDMPNGLGNDNDLVGRFFMEHLEVEIGKLSSFDVEQMKRLKRFKLASGSEIGAVFCVSEQQQRAQGIGNGAAFIAAPSFGAEANGWTSLIELRDAISSGKVPSNLGGKLMGMVRDIDTIVGVAALRAQGREMSTRISQKGNIDVVSIAEQTPNAESRVTLSNQTDAFGNPQANLAWRINERDKKTLQSTVQLLSTEFSNANVANLETREWLSTDTIGDWPATLRGGNHHMGTTRMASSPTQGVVDQNCQVHGLENLYVAGSSVFPTGGYSTPTLTIVALALKLSDHLKSKV